MLNENIFDLNNSPVYTMLKKYEGKSPARFHMPGHKGSFSSPLYDVFGNSVALDVTELPSTDNLFDPTSGFLEAERLASLTYKSKNTVFSCGGSTLCIQAMLRLVTRDGGTVLCARNVHKAVINTLALLNIEPVFVMPRPFKGSGLAGAIHKEDIESILKQRHDISAVFITSPDYYGVISNVKSIADVCHKYDVPLLCDNAHGAHLICFDSLHPLSLGADMTCDSAHKTLPCLTGGAFLHLNTDRYSKDDVKEAMMLFGSTSPSYFISLSLDLSRLWLDTVGFDEFSKLKNKVSKLREFISSLGFFTPSEAFFDPVRILIDTASRGLNGNEVAGLFSEKGIEVELSDPRHLVLIPTPFNTDEDFNKLKSALGDLKLKQRIDFSNELSFYYSLPEKKYSFHDTLLLKSEIISIDDCCGRISAETRCPCPPCIPIVMPGEVITKKIAQYLKSCGVLSMKVLK